MKFNNIRVRTEWTRIIYLLIWKFKTNRHHLRNCKNSRWPFGYKRRKMKKSVNMMAVIRNNKILAFKCIQSQWDYNELKTIKGPNDFTIHRRLFQVYLFFGNCSRLADTPWNDSVFLLCRNNITFKPSADIIVFRWLSG